MIKSRIQSYTILAFLLFSGFQIFPKGAKNRGGVKAPTVAIRVPDSTEAPIESSNREQNTVHVEDSEINEAQALALCLENLSGKTMRSLKVQSGYAGPVVTNIRGHKLIESDHFEIVGNVRGATIIRGKTPAANARLIDDIRGSLVICGLSVELLSNSKGRLFLVNSEVKSLVDREGDISLSNSKIGNVSNVRGLMKQMK